MTMLRSALAAATICAAGLAHALFDPAREYVETAAVAARFPDPAVDIPTPAFLAGRADFTSQDEMMAFVAAERPAAAMRLAEALPVSNGSEASSLPPEDALAAPLCEALLAFARNDYAVCVEWLQRVRRIAHRCGGSLTQGDVIHLTLTEAELRARKARLSRALVAERTAR